MDKNNDFKYRPDLNYEDYDTDKISNNYLSIYGPVLEAWVGKKITLLELGIFNGGSLRLWHDYFPHGKIVGVDLKLPKKFEPVEDIYMYEGSQANTKFLTDMANEIAPDGFDIIIDDASHIGELTKISFWHLFDNHLKPGGLFVIEDWGTGYWDDWPDGKSLDFNALSKFVVNVESSWLKFLRRIRVVFVKLTPKIISRKVPAQYSSMPCHSYGMVGFIKQLIDEQAANDVTRKKISGRGERVSKFKKIIINPSIVFVFKTDS